VEELERAAQLAGGPSADISRRLRTLRAAVAGKDTPPTPDTAPRGSAFAFAAAGAAARCKPGGDWLKHEQLPAALAALRSALPGAPELSDAILSSASAADFAARVLQAARGEPAVWATLQPALLAACADGAAARALLAALERGRQLCPPGSLPLPPPTEPDLLASAAGCELEAPHVRRAALESCNALLLDSLRGLEGAAAAAAWEAPPLAPMLRAGLAAACLRGAHSQPLRETACGVFHNLTSYALRSWAGAPELERAAGPPYERLCQLLDREGNPLDDEPGECARGDADAHAFFAPVASLLAAAPPALRSQLSRTKLLAEALAAARSPHGAAEALAGCATLHLLLTPEVDLRQLSAAAGRADFRARRESLAGDLLRLAAEADGLTLRPAGA
jgi:hypothetical protein